KISLGSGNIGIGGPAPCAVTAVCGDHSLPADCREINALAIDAKVNLMFVVQPGDGGSTETHKAHGDEIFTVDRKIMLRFGAASGSEGKILGTIVLRLVVFQFVSRQLRSHGNAGGFAAAFHRR